MTSLLLLLLLLIWQWWKTIKRLDYWSFYIQACNWGELGRQWQPQPQPAAAGSGVSARALVRDLTLTSGLGSRLSSRLRGLRVRARWWGVTCAVRLRVRVWRRRYRGTRAGGGWGCGGGVRGATASLVKCYGERGRGVFVVCALCGYFSCPSLAPWLLASIPISMAETGEPDRARAGTHCKPCYTLHPRLLLHPAYQPISPSWVMPKPRRPQILCPDMSATWQGAGKKQHLSQAPTRWRGDRESILKVLKVQ